MYELSRTIRFSIPFSHNGLSQSLPGRHNTFAAWPSVAGLGAFYEIVVRCRGEVDPRTGYLMSISAIDEAVRLHAVPVIATAAGAAARDGERDGDATPGRVLHAIAGRLGPALGDRVASVTWRLTPFYSLNLETVAMDRILIGQQFSFSASHRLHSDELSEEENRRIYGKCNNPHGHGHNYRLEVVASIPLAPSTTPSTTTPTNSLTNPPTTPLAAAAPTTAASSTAARSDARPPSAPPSPLPLAELERIVHDRVIQRFDHTHLNLDTEEFATLVPSVEHITRVCHDLLAVAIEEAGARLERVTVWETEKTWCTYPVE